MRAKKCAARKQAAHAQCVRKRACKCKQAVHMQCDARSAQEQHAQQRERAVHTNSLSAPHTWYSTVTGTRTLAVHTHTQSAHAQCVRMQRTCAVQKQRVYPWPPGPTRTFHLRLVHRNSSLRWTPGARSEGPWPWVSKLATLSSYVHGPLDLLPGATCSRPPSTTAVSANRAVTVMSSSYRLGGR